MPGSQHPQASQPPARGGDRRSLRLGQVDRLQARRRPAGPGVPRHRRDVPGRLLGVPRARASTWPTRPRSPRSPAGSTSRWAPTPTRRRPRRRSRRRRRDPRDPGVGRRQRRRHEPGRPRRAAPAPAGAHRRRPYAASAAAWSPRAATSRRSSRPTPTSGSSSPPARTPGWRGARSRCTAPTTSRRSRRPATRWCAATRRTRRSRQFLEAADGVIRLDSSGLSLRADRRAPCSPSSAEHAGLEGVLAGKDLLVELAAESVGAGRGA